MGPSCASVTSKSERGRAALNVMKAFPVDALESELDRAVQFAKVLLRLRWWLLKISSDLPRNG